MKEPGRPRALFWQQIYNIETVPIVAQRIEPMDGDFEPHSHDFIEIVLVLAGESRHISLNGERALAPRDVITLRPGAWHIYRACRQLEVYNCCVSAELFHHELAWMSQEVWFHQLFQVDSTRREHHSVQFFHFPQTVFDACLSHLDAIQQIKQADSVLQKTTSLGHLLLFFSEFARYISSEHTGSIFSRAETSRRQIEAASVRPVKPV